MKMPTVYILAGGLGTRLAHFVSDVPKPMAQVSAKPFLEWQVMWLARQGFTDIVMLVGYKNEAIRDYFKDGSSLGVKIRYSVESELLGTGGAFIQALQRYPADEYIIINGDSFFDVPLRWLVEFRRSSLPEDSFCIALKYSDAIRRYGSVSLGPDWEIRSFQEKSEIQTDGYINGGIYIAGRESFQNISAGKLSMENEIFPRLIADRKLFGIPFGGRFIDIGIYEDYRRADASIGKWFHQNKVPALFLDRDGILIEDTGYIKDADGLIYHAEFFELARKAYDKGFAIVIISNQAGIARGHLSIEDVEAVNRKIEDRFCASGVRPAGFYWCPYHEEAVLPEWKRFSLLRKPEPGMVLKAVEEHGIDPHSSIMVGDKDSDRIKLPYLRSVIIPGRYPVEDRGNIVDISTIEKIIALTRCVSTNES